jgi:hypothetical protein
VSERVPSMGCKQNHWSVYDQRDKRVTDLPNFIETPDVQDVSSQPPLDGKWSCDNPNSRGVGVGGAISSDYKSDGGDVGT